MNNKYECSKTCKLLKEMNEYYRNCNPTYIYKNKGNKYYIVHDFDDDLGEISNSEYTFIVDELIALPVKMLNEKGYKTAYSCSGHFFPDIVWDNYENNNFKNDSDTIYYSSADFLDGFVLGKLNYDILESYISFEKDYHFKNLPCDWQYDSKFKKIYKRYERNQSAFDFYKDMINSIEKLCDWIELLGSIN